MSKSAFSLAVISGTVGAGLGANSEIFQCRWTANDRKMLLRKVCITAGGIIAFTAGVGSFGLRAARSWTSPGTGGGTATFGTNMFKKRSNFQDSLMTDTGVRFSSTAALGAGTKTMDGRDLALSVFGVPASAGNTLGLPTPLWSQEHDNNYPLVFEKNEGFVILANVPATGTWTFGVSMEWDESDVSQVEGWG